MIGLDRKFACQPLGLLCLSVGLICLLASCAAPVAAGPRTAAPRVTGRFTPGTLVAIRAPNPAAAGLDAVLSALNVSPPAALPNVTEYVIRKDDGSAATLVQTGPAAPITAGDRVAIFENGPTTLIDRN